MMHDDWWHYYWLCSAILTKHRHVAGTVSISDLLTYSWYPTTMTMTTTISESVIDPSSAMHCWHTNHSVVHPRRSPQWPHPHGLRPTLTPAPVRGQLLARLARLIRALLAQRPLRVPLGGLKIMQPDPARAHVLYVVPDLHSPDGRRLRGLWCVVRDAVQLFFLERKPYFLPSTLRFPFPWRGHM